ncbi:MAG: efflux RND transporter periplasmic adaptor subunit [Muribaculaceae bacterium]|nr:efflux RND transporter periplasmic adaptor subunit [Muribaculaceae bacterium]
MSNNSQKKEERSLIIVLCAILTGVAILAITGFFFLSAPEEVIEGQADATAIRISGKLPGRVVKFYFGEGDSVAAGDTLVHIHSSLVEAKLMQAEAMETAASAQNRKVDSGTRAQIIQSAYELWQQAIAAKTIAFKTYERMESLYAQEVISEQKRDEALAAYQATEAAEKAAHSQYLLAVEGAQSEDKTSAAALVEAARGSVKEVESILEDQYLIAPCDGEIDEIYPNIGEHVALGAPIMSVLKKQDTWVTFNVRETLLNNLAIGDEIEIMIPALNNMTTKAKVFYIKDMGNYAVWRATKATGQWDSRTFQVKARPEENIKNLRPGMTIIYKQPEK